MAKSLTVSYEDEELRALVALSDWAWNGVGSTTWTVDHRTTLGQAVAAASKPLQDAMGDGIYRLALAGSGEVPMARLRRAGVAGEIGIREAAETLLASGGEPQILAALLNRLAVNRIAGPVVRGRGRWAAFSYLEQAVSAGLTRQRSYASRGRRVL